MSSFYGVETECGAVRGWSTLRLPFQPKGWLRDYREELRDALRSLEAVDGSGLRAEYASPDRDFADVENVLLYNIGAANYRHLACGGLEVSRTASPDALHRVSYQRRDAASPQPDLGDICASVSLDDVPSNPDKPGSWWAALQDRLCVEGVDLGGEYAIQASFRGDIRRFVSLVKPMLDGLIASLHVHDGTHEQHVRKALAEYGEADSLWESLNDPRRAILGRRTLVRPHGQRIAWNPADDLCRYFSVLPSGSGPLFRARVSATRH